MILIETNSADIVFRKDSATTITYETRFVEAGWIFVQTKPVKRTRNNVIVPLILGIHENDSKLVSPLSQQKSIFSVISDQNINGWVAYIKEEFYSVPVVESIYYLIEDNNIDLWLIIPEHNFAVLRQLVEREMKVLENFISLEHPLFQFEFHIIYRCGTNESNLIPKNALRIPR